jgi:hypothetical protein
MDPTDEEVERRFASAGYEPRTVERNRSRYRVFLDPEGVDREGVENTLYEEYGEESVFGVGVEDDLWGDDDLPVKVVSFRLR